MCVYVELGGLEAGELWLGCIVYEKNLFSIKKRYIQTKTNNQKQIEKTQKPISPASSTTEIKEAHVGYLCWPVVPGGNRMEAEAQRCPDSRQGSVVFIGLHLVKGFWGNTTSQGSVIFLCLWVE